MGIVYYTVNDEMRTWIFLGDDIKYGYIRF